ncbi:MAG: hypothetical protein N0C84_01025 [Candidatus Thiodiazotropha taylori]|uniref:Uncharacterized protein n=1 Tax=Candidatus Thiodiazotropha taylori TaxID=2792791 RepID=A0A9E4KA52_9GAMM|nr:hypothetical protein [Candidatus Thiodiazotropha taylori]MCW4255028.1 hypothetical protein [Candidatus Thiodiazotropha taylori]
MSDQITNPYRYIGRLEAALASVLEELEKAPEAQERVEQILREVSIDSAKELLNADTSGIYGYRS